MQKLKEFAIKDFLSKDCFIDGIAFTKENTKSFGIKKLFDISIDGNILKSYYENNNYYIYTSLNKLYRISEEGKTLISGDFLTVPYSKTFTYDNEIVVIFGTVSMGIIIKNNEITILNEGVYSLPENHNGIMFTANNNQIYYSESYNQLNFTSSRHKGGQIILDETFGKIIKLISLKSNLYIFCEKAIFKLNANGDSEKNSIIKIIEYESAIDEYSIQKNMNKIVFYINGRIFFMDENEKITEIKINNNISLIKTVNYSGVIGDKYLLEFLIGNNEDKYVFIYSTLENYYCLLNIENNIFCGKIIFSNDLKTAGIISETSKIFDKEKEYSIKINGYDFNSVKRKTIKSVTVYGKFLESNLSVKGEFIKSSINIKANTNTYFEAKGKIFDIDLKINKPEKIDKIVFVMEEKDYDI